MDRLYFPTEIKADDTGAISGLAWKFGVPDRIGDMILPGAFAKASFPIPLLFGHDVNDPVGTWDVGVEKSDGFHLTGKLLIEDVARAREVRALVKSGAARGISLGFITRKAKSRTGGGREISSIELLEASIVTVPMHPAARVTSAKSAIEAINLAAMLNRASQALSKGA